MEKDVLAEIPAAVLDSYKTVLEWCRGQNEYAAMSLAVGVMVTQFKLQEPCAYDLIGPQLITEGERLSLGVGSQAEAEVVHMLTHCLGAWMGLAMHMVEERKRQQDSKS